MANPKRQDSIENGEFGRSDGGDQVNGRGLEDYSSSDVGSGARHGESRENEEVGLAERSTEALVDEGDGDLFFQQNDGEDRLLRWLQALDLQVMGACRADERLKPLLKLNVSTGVAEDRLLAHLNQHFEASEVGMLARCLCIPLVSIRVGKIMRQGTLLCPSDRRGNLNLMVLPTSDLRISFVGDDGCSERLAILRSMGQRSAVTVEDITADNSGRSFSLKVPDNQVFYFWCSEKSKLLGKEFLAKMKDLLQKQPSLGELTGISEERLNCFATQLRAYLIGSTLSNTRASSTAPSLDMIPDHSELGESTQLAFGTVKPPRSRHNSSLAAKVNPPYQGCLSPRSSSFKEGTPRNLSSMRTAAREKLRRRGDAHLSAVENLPCFTAITTDASGTCDAEKDKAPEGTASCPLSASSFLESLSLESLREPAIAPLMSSGSQVSPNGSSLFSPYYCWCPPRVSSLQYTVSPPQEPLSSDSISSITLPPLPSLLPTTRSSVSTPLPPLDLSISSMDFPAFFPQPLVRLPLSASNSQQIPTFTPLMCDPIVHVPVIDVCSSGQGYLVSGSAISTTIPPLHPKVMSSLGPATDSVERGARETLRLLISSSNQTSPQLLDVLPAVLTSPDEKPGVLVTGSRGLYNGSQDVDALANGITAMGLVSLSGKSFGDGILKHCSSREELDGQIERPGGQVASSAEEHGSVVSNSNDRTSG